MGTHPIFESDFDCLTEGYVGMTWRKTPATAFVTVTVQIGIVVGFIALANGPRYVIMYGIAVSVLIGVLRHWLGSTTLLRAILENCATEEQQRRFGYTKQCAQENTDNLQKKTN